MAILAATEILLSMEVVPARVVGAIFGVVVSPQAQRKYITAYKLRKLSWRSSGSQRRAEFTGAEMHCCQDGRVLAAIAVTLLGPRAGPRCWSTQVVQG